MNSKLISVKVIRKRKWVDAVITVFIIQTQGFPRENLYEMCLCRLQEEMKLV